MAVHQILPPLHPKCFETVEKRFELAASDLVPESLLNILLTYAVKKPAQRDAFHCGVARNGLHAFGKADLRPGSECGKKALLAENLALVEDAERFRFESALNLFGELKLS